MNGTNMGDYFNRHPMTKTKIGWIAFVVTCVLLVLLGIVAAIAIPIAMSGEL
jgi:hypothetical protein